MTEGRFTEPFLAFFQTHSLPADMHVMYQTGQEEQFACYLKHTCNVFSKVTFFL